MPSVGMRRSTRVFGARVLRSGRRVWTEPREGNKLTRVAKGENDWIGLVDKSSGGEVAGNDCKNMQWKDENGAAEVLIAKPMIVESVPEGVMELKNEDLMFGIVYKRKRKRNVLTYIGSSKEKKLYTRRKRTKLTNIGLPEEKKFGKKFVRKQWRKEVRVIEPLEVCEDIQGSINGLQELAIFTFKSSFDTSYCITCFLTSVLGYMMKSGLGIRRLSAFVLSKPIFDAYHSHGVLFLQDSNTIKGPGVCIISGSRFSIPIFSVDFSAVPSCFIHMHTSMYIRSFYFPCLVTLSLRDDENDETSMDCDDDNDETSMDVVDVTLEPSFQIPFGGDHSAVVMDLPIFAEGDSLCSDIVAPANDSSEIVGLSSSAVRRKSSLRIVQFRNNRKIQKRTSFRLKRVRPTPVIRAQKDSGALSADFFRIRHNNKHFSAAAPSRVLRSSSSYKRNSTADSSKVLKSNLNVSKQDVCTNSCSTNLLIIEPDKCYRTEGAVITLELSVRKQWFLSVKKDGINRCTLTAQNVMRPPSFNRFTHATVWTGDGCWKLEFPNKQDWLIFKELYMKCSERNMLAPSASVIPIPRVQKVSIPGDSEYVPYVRPNSYITVKEDELTRALLKKGANYDMDSDDEEWLKNFNEELFAGGELQQLTPERFELIIDALEKSTHCPADEYSDKHIVDGIFSSIEPIRNYWTKKRKYKYSSVIRIFQLYQPMRNHATISKPVLRKKRSFKRQPSQGGRGKQRMFLQAIAEDLDAQEQKHHLRKVQKAKDAADRSEELAVLKRQRAQKLMENADLATYKALIALRIAEAAQVTESWEKLHHFFLGN